MTKTLDTESRVKLRPYQEKVLAELRVKFRNAQVVILPVSGTPHRGLRSEDEP